MVKTTNQNMFFSLEIDGNWNEIKDEVTSVNAYVD